MARLPELQVFARAHGLPLVSIADLIVYRQEHDHLAGALVGALPSPTH